MKTNIFAIFRNKYKESDKQPDYKMSTKDGEEFVEIGACWLKEGKDGDKYFSCKLRESFQDKPGYEIVGLNAEETAKAEETVDKEDSVTSDGTINVDDIPF